MSKKKVTEDLDATVEEAVDAAAEEQAPAIRLIDGRWHTPDGSSFNTPLKAHRHNLKRAKK